MDREHFVDDYLEYTDEELASRWNFLETLKLTSTVELEMDKIEDTLLYRGVIAWNAKGEIIERD